MSPPEPRFAGRVRARSLSLPPPPGRSDPPVTTPEPLCRAGLRGRWDGGQACDRVVGSLVGESKTVSHTLSGVAERGARTPCPAPPRLCSTFVVCTPRPCPPHLTAHHRTSRHQTRLCWVSVFFLACLRFICSYPPPPQPSTPITPLPSIVCFIHGVAFYSRTLRR